MKKLVLLFICLILSVQSSFAHSPYAIRVKKDLANDQLHITVMHRVAKGSRAAHYVEKIEVAVDDQEPIVEEFTSQRNRRFQKTAVTVPDLRNREKIRIRSQDNKGCPIEKEFILREIEDYVPE
jgi:hypothetical protein